MKYPKIDIFVSRNGKWEYVASTTWSKTCKEAKARYWQMKGNIHIDCIKTSFNRKAK